MNYCGVIVNNESVAMDRVFTYAVPDNLKGKLRVGMHVRVPFGRGNKKIDGFVFSAMNSFDENIKIKAIEEIVSDDIIISEANFRLIAIMKKRYLCTYLEGIKLFLPKGLLKGQKEKEKKVLITGAELAQKYSKPQYRKIYALVLENEGKFSKSEMVKEFGVSQSSINTLIKHGFLEISVEKVSRIEKTDFDSNDKKVLTGDQVRTVRAILDSERNEFLIHGVTGCGKTEIYLRLVEEMLKSGKDSVVLVPEISLTPQMVERFKGRFGDKISVYHSRLSPGEKFDEWNRIHRGEVKIAVGARSALFLPFKNLGLIVVDEEHESSYKSDSDPKYLASEIALLKGHIEGCKVVLGSATPNVETYYKFKRNGWQIISLLKRVDGAKMPQVHSIDMRDELKKNNRSFLSEKLHLEIGKRLEKKEQIILFLNRRGFSTFISCRECGYVFKCSKCDISLTYHKGSGRLHCHYCGYNEYSKNNCPECGSKYVKYFGLGTEKIQDEIEKEFPQAKVLRMDHDTTRKKDSYLDIYNSFKNKEADILVGTQMIAKGLDFPDVTLVGIIAADLTLNLPDFRANERTFQLITQVSGRAGRGEKEGEVILQTYSPENYAIKYSLEADYLGFMEEEISIREAMRYPPFGRIMNIYLYSEDEGLLIRKANELGNMLKFTYREKYTILGPCPSNVSKINNQYRWQIMIKGNVGYEDGIKIKNMVYDTSKSSYNKIKVGLDMNPYNAI